MRYLLLALFLSGCGSFKDTGNDSPPIDWEHPSYLVGTWANSQNQVEINSDGTATWAGRTLKWTAIKRVAREFYLYDGDRLVDWCYYAYRDTPESLEFEQCKQMPNMLLERVQLEGDHL